MEPKYTVVDFLKDVLKLLALVVVVSGTLGLLAHMTGCASPKRASGPDQAATPVPNVYKKPSNAVERCVVLVEHWCYYVQTCDQVDYDSCMFTNLVLARCHELTDEITEEEFDTCTEAMDQPCGPGFPVQCDGIIDSRTSEPSPQPETRSL